MYLQNLVDTVVADFNPTSERIKYFRFSTPYTIESMIGVAPAHHGPPKFYQLAALLFKMFDAHLWLTIGGISLLLVLALVIGYVR